MAETNLYAAQVIHQVNSSGEHTARRWTPLTNIDKLINFFGILIYRSGIAPGQRNHKLCWSDDEYETDIRVKECMTLFEFQQLRRFFHMTNNASAENKAAAAYGTPTHDPTYKIKPLTEEVKETF